MADDDISGGFADTVDPRIAEYLRYAGASNMSIQPGRAMGALAAQDGYAPPAPTPPPPPEDSYDPFAAEKFVPQPIAKAIPGIAQADYAKLMSGRSADNSPVLYPISGMPGGGLTQQDMDRAMSVGMAVSGGGLATRAVKPARVAPGEILNPSRGNEAGTLDIPVLGPSQQINAPYIQNPVRVANPGIYKRPDVIAAEAAARVEPEHPALKQLFGVTRQDLYDISQAGTRQGNKETQLWQPGKPGAPNEAALAVMVGQ